MQTERFKRLRKNQLDVIYKKNKIINIWRKIVRDQLRNLDLKDIYDHYDFNYNIEERASTIRSEILNGSYNISQSLVYRIEKKYGICRHLVIPQPGDALVLQVLVEYLASKIIENQPSENAFYSRDKHNLAKPHQFDEYPFTWKKQWKELQKKIYKFNEEKELIVVTDLANYFDSIDIRELRKVFSSYAKINEVVIDLLFRVIEKISWNPDYLPYSNKGLPITNIEAIRLLAHVFLFEVDEVLKQRTNNCFTRWMDDIVIGVNNKREAIETISSTSDILKSRGLALNMSKTDIYNSDRAYYHFQIQANKYLDSLSFNDETKTNEISKELLKRFNKHLKDTNSRYWDKVAKRYITAFGKLRTDRLIPKIRDLYINYPSLRQNLIYYLISLGYSKKRSSVLYDIFSDIEVFDDISLFQLCNLVTLWEIPINNHTEIFLSRLEDKLIKFSKRRKLPVDFFCILWFKAKYSHPEELFFFIDNYKNIWQTDSFLRRQVTGIFSRLLYQNNPDIMNLLNVQRASGITSTVTLANQLYHFLAIKNIDKKLSYYLFPSKHQRPYPLQKFLVLCSVLNSKNIRRDNMIKEKVLIHINDPYYLKWIDMQYNIK